MAEITPAEIEPFLWQLWEAKGTALLFTVGIPPMPADAGCGRPMAHRFSGLKTPSAS
jgi:hypothetical protein